MRVRVRLSVRLRIRFNGRVWVRIALRSGASVLGRATVGVKVRISGKA